MMYARWLKVKVSAVFAFVPPLFQGLPHRLIDMHMSTINSKASTGTFSLSIKK